MVNGKLGSCWDHRRVMDRSLCLSLSRTSSQQGHSSRFSILWGFGYPTKLIIFNLTELESSPNNWSNNNTLIKRVLIKLQGHISHGFYKQVKSANISNKFSDKQKRDAVWLWLLGSTCCSLNAASWEDIYWHDHTLDLEFFSVLLRMDKN